MGADLDRGRDADRRGLTRMLWIGSRSGRHFASDLMLIVASMLAYQTAPVAILLGPGLSESSKLAKQPFVHLPEVEAGFAVHAFSESVRTGGYQAWVHYAGIRWKLT